MELLLHFTLILIKFVTLNKFRKACAATDLYFSIRNLPNFAELYSVEVMFIYVKISLAFLVSCQDKMTASQENVFIIIIKEKCWL
jgi:hypothetical protein